MYTWSLDALYSDFNESFDNDVNRLKSQIQAMQESAASLETMEDLEHWLKLDIETSANAQSLFSYISLRLSTNTTDIESNNAYGKLQPLVTEMSKPYAQFKAFIAHHADVLESWIASSPLIAEHAFMLREIARESKHLLNDDVEEIIAKMKMNASSNWSKLQGHLTSQITTEIDGKTYTLSSIRNLAYSPDAATRRIAYDKELEMYQGIEDAVAFALNSIKGEVNTLSEMRGYESALEKTLADSRLSKETLDALLQAIESYLPVFRKYFNHKATLFGHDNGLPWYDLFAPFETKNPKTYTIEDSRTMILDSFGTFSPDLHNMAMRAYDEKWIDFLPREGKRGGAFCSNQPQIKQSRILTNFDGSMSDIITLAHELGHAYHGMLIEDLSILNTDYTMPVAETASTFCENIVLNAALAEASDEEKLILIENSISDLAQITVDILSRYKFESEVFERRKTEFLFANDLKEIMIQAQKDTYGDGLNQNYMHPYMWINKGHYYSGGLSFYNFPYAFGGLFALGLFGKYQEEGAVFVPHYQELLKATTTASCEDVAALAGIDVTSVAFWESSLNVVAERIETFIALTKK